MTPVHSVALETLALMLRFLFLHAMQARHSSRRWDPQDPMALGPLGFPFSFQPQRTAKYDDLSCQPRWSWR